MRTPGEPWHWEEPYCYITTGIINRVKPGQPRSQISGTYRIYGLLGYPWLVSGWGREPMENTGLPGKWKNGSLEYLGPYYKGDFICSHRLVRTRPPWPHKNVCCVAEKSAWVCVWGKEAERKYNLCPLKEFSPNSLQYSAPASDYFVPRYFYYV